MKKRPNVLLLFPDQHRGDWMPYTGVVFQKMGIDRLPVKMPYIRGLMQRGVTFTNAISSSPVCAPARACLASGRQYEHCGVQNNWFDYNLQIPTFYSALKNAGYQVGGAGKFDLHKRTQEWGLTGWCDFLKQAGFTCGIDNAGKFDAAFSGAETPKDPYMALLHQKGYARYYAENIQTRNNSVAPLLLPDELYCDNWIGQNARRLIEGFSSDSPWFLQVNFAGPHNPWDVTQRMRERWKDVSLPLPNHAKETEEYDINGIRQNYAAMLENIDRICGELQQAVEQRGELDDTLIIYASDHGELLGDFNLFGKSKPQRGSVHIPLVIAGADVPGGRYSDCLAELQDLASTILDFAGISPQFTEESFSLRPLLLHDIRFPRDYQRSALNENGYWEAVQTHKWKLVSTATEVQEVYDLQTDPWQNDNLLESNPPKARELLSRAALETGRSFSLPGHSSCSGCPI